MKKNSKNKIARIYSTALYEAAAENKAVDKVWQDVLHLKQVLAQNSDLSTYLTSPLWSESDKTDVLQKTAKTLGLSVETLNCLEVVTENQRVADLAAILDDFGKIYYQKNNIAEVDVETVKELTAKQDAALIKALEKNLSHKVVVNYHLNPLVLGGLRIRLGSKMIDDSLASKLNYLENVMKGK